MIVNGYTIEPNANLASADLSHANLVDVDLSGANLSGANLTQTKLSYADLTGANLTGADLLWQVGGGLWCGLGIALLVDTGHVKLTLGTGAFGLLLGVNPLLDLMRGPVQGVLLSSGTEHGAYGRGSGTSAPTIHGTLVLETDAGEQVVIQPMGAQANRMESQTQACPRGGRVHALRHLDVVLTVVCAE